MIEHSNLIDKSRLKFSKEKILATSLILPSLILVFVTYLYPAIFTFVISFAEYDIIRLNIKKFVQFKNYNINDYSLQIVNSRINMNIEDIEIVHFKDSHDSYMLLARLSKNKYYDNI